MNAYDYRLAAVYLCVFVYIWARAVCDKTHRWGPELRDHRSPRTDRTWTLML